MSYPPRLAVVLDGDDLADLTAGGADPRALTLLAMDPDVHLFLRGECGSESEPTGICETSANPNLTPWDFVRREDWAEVQTWAESVWRFWEEHASLHFDGFDLLRIASYRHYECFNKLAWASFVLRRAIERLRPAEVVTFIERSGHGLTQPPAYRKYPPLFALLRGMAEQTGLPVRLIERGGSAFVDHAAAATVHAVAGGGADSRIPDDPYVLLYGNGVDLLQQLPLIHAIQADESLRAVQVYKSADADVIATCGAAGHIVIHESELAASIGVIDNARPAKLLSSTQAARARFRSAGAHAGLTLRAIFDNPHLDIHFDFIFGEYVRRIARHVATWSKLCRTRPPAAVVAHDQVPLTHVARACGVPVLSLAHGLSLDDTRWFSGLTPVVGAVSEQHRSQLIAAGMQPSDVAVTGSLWLDRFVSRSSATVSDARAARAAVSASLAIPSNRKIVLLCTSTAGTFSKSSNLPHAHWLNALKDLCEIAQMSARHRDWAIVIKAHPRYDQFEFYEHLRRTAPDAACLRVTTTAPLDDLAMAADATVLPNVRSSTLVEASFAGRPVFVLDGCLLGYNARQALTYGWPHVHSVAELEESLARVLSDPGSWQAAVDQTQAGLAAMLGERNEPAAPRCAAWLRAVAQQRSARTDAIHREPANAR